MGIYDVTDEPKAQSKPNKEKQAKQGVIYVNGVSKTMIKKIAHFWFGESVVLAVQAINNNREFCITVNSQAQAWQIKQFSDYWQAKVMQAS